MSKPLELTRQMILQMLGDPHFYDHCPVLFALRQPALAAYAAFRKAVKSRQRADHDPAWENVEAFQPVLGSFVHRVLALHAAGSPELIGIHDYLAERLGSRAPLIVLRYMEHGEVGELQF